MLSSLVVMFFIHVNHYLGEGEHKTGGGGGRGLRMKR